MRDVGCEMGIGITFFSKHSHHTFRKGNVCLRPVQNEAFVKSLASSRGVICGAGFETPAEALFLEKKLLVIPIKDQFEQHCNAAALHELGVPVLKNLKKKRIPEIAKWLKNEEAIHMDYPDHTEAVVKSILEQAEASWQLYPKPLGKGWKELILSSF